MNPSTDIETGTVGILNVGDGDTKLSFNKNNPAERIRAARIVKDMIRRGYALLIEIERDGQKVFTRAVDFDEDVCEYIIADFDPIVSETVDAEVRVQELKKHEQGQAQADAPQGTTTPTPKRGPSRPAKTKAVPAEGAKAIAVARSAGG